MGELLYAVVAGLLVLQAAMPADGATVARARVRDGASGQYKSAAVASDGTPCAEIGVDIMKNGGTAADAAIATVLCTGVVNPHSTGLGGGFLLTLYDKSEGVHYTLDAREMAALAATRDMYHGDGILAQEGGLAVAVPGALRGFSALYEKFGGGVPWADLFTPTIKLCEDGNPVNFHMAMALQAKREQILAEPSMSVFVDSKTGDVLQEGDILFLPDLGATLRTLQDRPDALYVGELASQFVQDLTDHGGIITEEDMAQYSVIWDEPLSVHLENSNTTLYSVKPPSSGVLLAFILNILDGYNFDQKSVEPDNAVLTHQRIIESFKYAYAMRTYLGDGAFVNMEGMVANLTSEAYAAKIRGKILDHSTSQDPVYYGAYHGNIDDHGTSHVSILAPNGDAVAVTSTINSYFGAIIRSTKTGIVYNDEMDDFSSPNITSHYGIPPSPTNYIVPGKRPLSSMCPAILLTPSGDVRLVIGASGGTKITTAVAFVAAHNLWFNYNIEDAITTHRIHHQLYPMAIENEEGFSETILDGLKANGHLTQEFPEGGAVVCGLSVQDGTIYANADFRKHGQVDGF